MTTSDLSERYGAPPAWRRRLTRAVVAVVVVVSLGWLLWTMAFHSDPAVRSELATFEVTGEHEVRADLRVWLKDGVDATCRLRAYAEDHTTVGDLAFVPVDGANEVAVRTERRATTVEKLGCTAPGQPRPR